MSDLFAPDEQALRALNNAFAEQTSFLDEAGWARLTAAARFAFMAPDALLLAFDQDGDYDSPNFLWFRDRYERFIYVDRIAVAASAQGKGMGRALYARLFAEARAAAYPCVTCEVNLTPPNPGSLAFHHRLGFETVGEAVLSPGKAVRYMAKAL